MMKQTSLKCVLFNPWIICVNNLKLLCSLFFVFNANVKKITLWTTVFCFPSILANKFLEQNWNEWFYFWCIEFPYFLKQESRHLAWIHNYSSKVKDTLKLKVQWTLRKLEFQETQPISGWWIGQIPCNWYSEILILEKSGANFRTPIT